MVKKSNSILVSVLTIFISLCCSMPVYSAEAYAIGTGPLQVFNSEAFSAAPLAAKVWLVFMLSTFFIGLIFVRRHVIARWAVGGLVVSMLTGHTFFALLGLPMLSGAIAIWHIVCWSPALVLLLLKCPFLVAKENPCYRVWSGVMTIVILISFVFDFRDGWIYIQHFSGLAG